MKATQRTLAIAMVLMLGATSLAHAGAEINLVGDPDKSLYDPAEAITVSIYATMTEAPINPVVELRGMQLDYQATDSQIGLPETMDFVNPPPGLYAEFEALPIPASVCLSVCGLFPGSMIELLLDEPVLFGTVEITAPDEMDTTGTLDVANAGEANINFGGSLTFGWGGTPDDPITVWRFNTGELTGGTLDITTVPEPATVVMLLLILAVGPRTRRL